MTASPKPSTDALPKSWDPGAVESELYQGWVDAGYFKADPASDKPPYSIVLPPNVTGSLHMGHALDHTLMDALTRRRRMQGYEVLWLPGMDHAGIATQSVVEKQLAVDGKTKEDFGRELFIDKVWDWKHDSGGTIGAQMRRLGDGVDWSRDRFTMDDGLSRAVRTIFKRLYDAGLIYQAERLVNWSPVLETAISDLEVSYSDVEGELVSFRYGLSTMPNRTSSWPPPGSRRCSATPRSRCIPTMSATATWSARRCRIPFVDRQMIIVADEHVDPEFGTGAVKVTPARPERLRDRPAAQAADAVDHGHQGPDHRHRNAIRRHGPLDARVAVREALAAEGRIVERSGRICTASGIPNAAENRSNRGCRCSGGSRSSHWPRRRAMRCATAHRDSPAKPGTALVRLGRQHARLVHLPAAVVGPPHPDLARP